MKLLVPALLAFTHLACFAIANPSSVFCGEVGGKQNPGKETCSFGPDSGIGAWTLFHHAKSKRQQLAVEAYFRKVGRPNPQKQKIAPVGPSAENYCVAYGGQFRLDHICKFKDGSEIDAVTLVNGPTHEKNAKLTEVLNAQ